MGLEPERVGELRANTMDIASEPVVFPVPFPLWGGCPLPTYRDRGRDWMRTVRPELTLCLRYAYQPVED
ncbi:MAG: hypothetical protein CM1200mP9_12170 [Gammaproteobacteria bacterium]|nr:MAG: hypothetical protein CM1200mP9_12170 [Gammaproteobacteria bacterium]